VSGGRLFEMKAVKILISTFNGEQYLEEQLKSLLKQKNVEVKIQVRDDGSTDRTQEILERYKKAGKLEWYSGRNIGPARSYMELIYGVAESEYYAFCDQDDVWLEDKLEKATKKLSEYPENIPALYYGLPQLVDEELRKIEAPKSSKDRMLDFNSALIESNATGCTMVFNASLLTQLKKGIPDYIAMHDRWAHKVCIAVKGHLYFDENVPILYRQHSKNVVGISSSYAKKVKKKLFGSKECRSRTIKSLLNIYKEEMSPEEIRLATLVANYRDNGICKLKLLLCRKVRCNYFLRNVVFRIMVVLGTF